MAGGYKSTCLLLVKKGEKASYIEVINYKNEMFF